MTVAELIEILKTMPQDYDVTVYNDFEGGVDYKFEIIQYDNSKQIQFCSWQIRIRMIQ